MLGSAACTKKTDEVVIPSDTTPATTVSTTAPTTTSEPPATTTKRIDKSDFVKKADAVCKAANDAQAKLSEPSVGADDDEVHTYLEDVLSVQKDSLADLEGLGDAPEDGDAWKDVVDAYRNAVAHLETVTGGDRTADEILADPEMPELLDAARTAAKAFGLKVCGAKSGTSSSSTTTTKKSGTPRPTVDALGSTITPAQMTSALKQQGWSDAFITCVLDDLEAAGVPLKPDADLTEDEAAAHRAAGTKCGALYPDKT